jgi:hypothetical protein
MAITAGEKHSAFEPAEKIRLLLTVKLGAAMKGQLKL